MSQHPSANFDVRSPVQVAEYDATAQQVNPGYGLAFELVTALLRVACPAEAHLLLVGAGGSTEVPTFAAAEPGWILTAVDPSANMLALARASAAAAGLADRVRLVHGTLDDLAPDARFDAATAMYVLMHVPDDGSKLHLLRSVAQRLKPGAPLLLVDSQRDQRERFLPAMECYAAARGMAAEQRAVVFTRIRANTTTATEERERALLTEAGFREVLRFSTAFTMTGWLATR